MAKLNVNVDHIATLRQARKGIEPVPVHGAQIAVLAGADGIVVHLREDRRHINDRDVRLIRDIVDTRFDLEMAATEEIIGIALEVVPELVTIVPEKRTELTTEGGLDVIAQKEKMSELCKRMHDKGIIVSMFVEPDADQIYATKESGADMIELHTGNYANNYRSVKMSHELNKIKEAAKYAHGIGLGIAAGHGLNYFNIKELIDTHEIDEFSIGHSIIARAVFVGLDKAVKDMVSLISSVQ